MQTLLNPGEKLNIDDFRSDPLPLPGVPGSRGMPVTATTGAVRQYSQYRFTWKLKFKFEFWFLGHLFDKIGPRTP